MDKNALTQAQAMYAVMKEACDAAGIDYGAHGEGFARYQLGCFPRTGSFR